MNEAQEKEKNEKIELMKQGPAENMALAIHSSFYKNIVFQTQAGYSYFFGLFKAENILTNTIIKILNEISIPASELFLKYS